MPSGTVVIIGHRDYICDGHEEIDEPLKRFIRSGYTRFLIGGMGRFDLACAMRLYRLKLFYPHIRLCLVQPFPGYRITYEGLFDEIIYPEALEDVPSANLIPERNRIMIENASAALCFVERDYGGAYESYCIAVEKGLRIVQI